MEIDEIKLNEQRQIFSEMIHGFKEYEETIFAPSPVIWSALSDRFTEDINNFGIGDFQADYKNDFFGTTFGFGSTITPGRTTEFDSMLWSVWNNILERDSKISKKLGIESIVSRTMPLETSPNRTLDPSKISGRPGRGMKDVPINWDYLFSLDTILYISERIPEILTGSVAVCELGAGWGRIAHYLSQINPKIRYYIFDIPTSLIVSYCYLKDSGANVHDFSITKSSEFNDLRDPGIYCMLSGDLDKIRGKEFALFVNQASFQEMTPEQVSGYFDIIDRTSENFYTFQRYMDLSMSYESYPVKNNWEVISDGDSIFNPLWFEQFIKIN
jgi:putative sugar O-methyltransferase